MYDPYDVIRMQNQRRAIGQTALDPEGINAILQAKAINEQRRLAEQEQIRIQNERTQLARDEEQRRQEQQDFQNWMGIGQALGNVALFGPMAYQGWNGILGGGAATTETALPAWSAGTFGGVPIGTAPASSAIPSAWTPGTYGGVPIGTQQAAITGSEAAAPATGWGAAATPIGVGGASAVGAYEMGRAIGGPKLGWTFVNPFVGISSYTDLDRFIPRPIHDVVDKTIDTFNPKNWF